jgi:DNA topoisomerase-1
VSPGVIEVYTEGLDDAIVDEQDHILPAVVEGDRLSLKDVQSAQHFTEPPPRYSEATLVKALEEFGIGRPSTYASIISTLRNREYVEMENRRFIPTDVGRVVNRFLTQFFPHYVDYEFTARMEDDLDAVSRGEREWVPLLEEFWKPFSELVEHTETNVTREQASQARVLGTDPASGRPVSVRMGRYGAFVQIGTKEDEDKPKFAGLRPGQKMDTITLDVALDLFKLPRELGTTADGEPVSANIGRFGPYVRYESNAPTPDGKKKAQFVSIRGDDPYTITLERALQLIAEKKVADANKLIRDFPDAGIQVLNGRYGPYVTDKKKNAKIPKDRVPKELTLEECQALLAAAPERRARGMRRGKPAATAASAASADETSAPLPAAAATKKTKKKTKKTARKKSAARKSSPTDKAASAESSSPTDNASSADGDGGETPDA